MPKRRTVRGVTTPSAVVTFLLTDIAGSSRLWETAPTAMAEALVRHDAIVREVVSAHGGTVVKPRGEGDSTFSVFDQPVGAATAALALQEALAAEPWALPSPLRLRIAIHAGEALALDGDYYGPVVNRVARLRGSAAPGQILVSTAAADLVAGRLGEGARLVPIGQQTLRDLSQPEHVYRLQRAPIGGVGADGDDDRPAGVTPAVPFPARLAVPANGFVGRERELALIGQRASDLAEGGVGLVLVSGEPGIGKTRLAAEASQAAHRAGMIVLYGRCDEELGIPYQPFVEALRHYIEAAPQDLLDRFAARHGGDLARLIPGLAERAAWLSTPAASDPEAECYLLFEAVLRLLEVASGEAPVVLVLDDLHRADRNTLLLVRHALESTARLRLLMIATYRHSDIQPGHALPEFVTALSRDPATDRLRLGGLDDAELGCLVAELAGAGLDDRAESLVRWLRRETDGNPFFTDAMLRHLVDSGAISREDGGWTLRTAIEDLKPPESVIEVIQHRVDRLGEHVQRTLSSAAIIGREFDLGLLAATLGEPEDSVLTALEQAAAAALIAEVPASPGRFTFVHALVGHGVYEGLGATRRTRLHRTVAEQLEARCGPDPGDRLPELATHWLAARVPDQADRTIDYARRAGDHALERLAPDEAVRWFEEALALAREVGIDERRRVDLLIRLGVAQRQAGDVRFRATLLEAAGLAERLGDRDALVRAALANNRGDRAVSGRVDRDRLRVLDRALSAVGDGDSSARAKLLATLGLEWNFGGGWEQQLAFSDDALAIARRLADPATLAAVLALRHETIRLPHTLPERLKNTAEHLEIAQGLGDPAQIGFAALWRTRASWEAGDLAEVDRCMVLVTELAGVHPYLRWNAATHLSYRHLLAGRIDEAERATMEAYRLGETSGQLDAGAFLAGQLIMVRWDQGRLGELEPMLEGVVRDYPGLPAFRGALALAYCETERPDRARDLFDREAASGFAAFRYDPLWLCAFLLLGEVCAQLGDGSRAGALYERLAPWRGQLGFSGVSLFGSVAHYLGQLATAAGRFDTAEADLAEAAGTHERLGAPVLLARTRLATARLLAQRGAPGDSARASALTEEALAMATRLGATGLIGRASTLPAALQASDGQGDV
jgi:class 3 adenylate cyclase